MLKARLEFSSVVEAAYKTEGSFKPRMKEEIDA